ncbi:MAG: UDP-2,3-diacylglucosamine diphosphatase [Candidatus Methanoperedens sp.]
MGIIAVSDVHLGYDKSDEDAFRDFLVLVSEMKNIDKFVICGDCFDMWRRDIAGVIIEYMDIFQQLQLLKSENKMEVHYIVGNHDYHLLNPDYFEPLSLEDDGKIFRFTHGYEYEPIMRASRHAFDMLCYSNDEIGGFGSDVWERLSGLFINLQTREIVRPAKERLNDQKINEIEKKASEVRLREGETLVFGHTHKPFINREGTMVNLGSWVKDSDVHNTYLEIQNGTMTLNKFISKEEIEPIEPIG